jgi:hypothetical protein
MEKQILKKIDNIRNNLLHSTDNLSKEEYPEEKINDIISDKIDILSNLSAFRSKLVKLFNKKD